MKKLFVLMAAAFAMVACQTDINEVGVVAGGEVDVTFEVGTPTRAYSDGKTATVLQYAVYEMNDEGATLLGSLTGSKTINISTKVELQLVTGNTYTVIFWAAAPNAPYSVDWATGTMTVDYSAAVCNAENRDAFYKRHTFTVKGAQTETIELRRPFAQLNIGTNDYADASKAGYTPVNSAVKVTKVYKTLDLWEGGVSEPVVVDFDYDTIAKGETFPVTGYQYLAMNYLLVGSDKEVVDIEFSYTESDAAAAKTRIVGSVPVQRNYRTNIYGQLLTSDVEINVEIKPEYETPDNNVESGFFSEVDDIVSLQEAIDEAPAGELTTIILSQDIDLYAATRSAGAGYVTRVENGSNIIIDGRGHKLNGQIRIDGKSELGQETTIIRNVNFESSVANTDFIWTSKDNTVRYANNVTIENCTFTATGEAVNTAVGVRVTQAYNFAINGCVATDLHSLAQVSSYDNAIVIEDVTVNGKNGIALGNAKNATIKNANITATGYGIRADALPEWAPSLSVETANITAAQPIIIRKVAAGVQPYAVNLDENVALTSTEVHQVVFTAGADDAAYVAPAEGSFSYTSANDFVVFPYVVAVSTWEELVATTASKVVLAADVTFASNYQWNKAMTLDLNGKSITLPMINIHSAATFKNGTINGKVYARKGANIVLDNVTLSGAVSDNLSTEGHLAIQSGCTLYVKDCLFSPTSVSGSQTKPISFEGGSSNMKFENCEFKSSPYKKQVYFNPLSATASLEFVNCNFNNKTPNIMFAAAAPLTVLKMNGTTKLGSVTLETNRAKDAVTAEDLA
ncbi:MAG: hypothetical protein IIV24_02900, partial [Alistipes sp.]|nr:hypothetical protein [Alistipes sp.]